MSGYGQNRPLPIGVNKKVIGLMKDELDERVITEFVALRPGGGDKTCKGVKKCVVKKTLEFDDYKHCLFADMSQSENMYQKQLMFQKRLHEFIWSR